MASIGDRYVELHSLDRECSGLAHSPPPGRRKERLAVLATDGLC